MTNDEYLKAWGMVSNLWSREIDPHSVSEARLMFAGLEPVDVRVAVKDLFSKGSAHPPNPSVLYASSKAAEGRRLKKEREDAQAISDRALPSTEDSMKGYAEAHNGYSPVQVFRNSVHLDVGVPAFPEFHDPALPCPKAADEMAEFVPVRPERGGQAAAHPDPF